MRDATPPASSPARSGRTSSQAAASGESGSLVTATVRLTPACGSSARSVSFEPPPAETATQSVSGDGGCGRPVDAYSAYASSPRARSAAAQAPAANRDEPMPRKSTRRASGSAARASPSA